MMNLIELDALVDFMCVNCAVTNKDYCREHGPCPAYGYAMKVPVIDAKPVVHGEWIDKQEDEASEGMWQCSACGSERDFYIMTPFECDYYYCPHCGAKMTEAMSNEER